MECVALAHACRPGLRHLHELGRQECVCGKLNALGLAVGWGRVFGRVRAEEGEEWVAESRGIRSLSLVLPWTPKEAHPFPNIH